MRSIDRLDLRPSSLRDPREPAVTRTGGLVGRGEDLQLRAGCYVAIPTRLTLTARTKARSSRSALTGS
ncbi:MAG: hypothetical protein WAL04_10255, partial [Acidimicrobiales bacterium]